MIEIGKSLPNLTDPAATTGAAEVFAFKALSFFRRDHAGRRRPDQPTRAYSAKVGTGFAIRIRANYLCGLEYQGCAAGDIRRHHQATHTALRGNSALPMQCFDPRDIGDFEAQRVECHPLALYCG
jgi:hypothetical protein